MITPGRVPAGMVFGSDCSIVGRPTESTITRFTVRVGASGVSNTILTSAGITVNGPSIGHAVTGSSDVGLIVNDPAQFGNWTPDGRPVAWTFTLKRRRSPAMESPTRRGGISGIEVRYPFSVRHSLDSTPRALGVPLNIAPTATTISPVPLFSPSTGNYTPLAGQCSLPTGETMESKGR